MQQTVETRQPKRIEPTANANPVLGELKPSFLKRLKSWRQTHLTAGRIKVARRGWSRLWFYSFELAFDFLRAFWRLSPQLGLKESAHWTNVGVRLARADADLAAEFFKSGSEAILKLPSAVRERLFALNANLPYLYSTETMRERLRLALTVATRTDDEELAARILDIAITISRSSLGYSRDFLRRAAEVISRYSATNSLQRTLFLRALDLAERLSVHLAVKFFDAVAPHISAPQSDGAGASATQLCEQLIEHTGSLVASGHAGGLNFFLCGLELLRLGDEELIDK